jgi:hypothetical protein
LGFPTNVYTGIIKAINRAWPADLAHAALQGGDSWTAVLNGTPWKKSGHEELERVIPLSGAWFFHPLMGPSGRLTGQSGCSSPSLKV